MLQLPSITTWSSNWLIPFALISLLFIIPLFQQAYYLCHCYLFNPIKGSKAPYTKWSQPLGLRNFYALIQAMRNEKLPFHLKRIFTKNPNIRTGRLQALGKFIFWTVEPENVKAILATQFKDFCLGTRHHQFFPLLGDGIFTLDGSGWHHSRAMLRPQFSREQVSRVDSLEAHIQHLINAIEQNTKLGKYVDIQSLFFYLTIDTATEFLFGESVSLLTGGNPRIPDAKEFGEAFNRAQFLLAVRANAQDFHPLVTSKQFKRDCDLCKSLTDSFVKLALDRYNQNCEKTQDSYIFLDELTKETRDPEILRNQSLNILLAGRDTTASLLSFVFMELSRHPDVYQKLRKEIIETFGTGRDEITFESLKRCLYLRHVINETLRLFPTVPSNYRVATKNTTLPLGGGSDGQSPTFIPKGSIVGYNVFSMQRHPILWGPDSNEFRPERWYDYSPKSHHTWDFIPFNGGPRICLGQQFALTEAGYTIVRLLQKYETLEPMPGLFSEGEEESVQAQLTMCVGGPEGVSVKLY